MKKVIIGILVVGSAIAGGILSAYGIHRAINRNVEERLIILQQRLDQDEQPPDFDRRQPGMDRDEFKLPGERLKNFRRPGLRNGFRGRDGWDWPHDWDSKPDDEPESEQ